MKCKCIEKLNVKIKEATKDPESSINVLYSLSNGINNKLFITYSFRDKKKDGTFTKPRQGKLTLSRCPFCGIESE